MSKKRKKPKPDYKYIDVPVVNGVATMPDGSTVRSSGNVIRLPVLTKRGAAKLAVASTEFNAGLLRTREDDDYSGPQQRDFIVLGGKRPTGAEARARSALGWAHAQRLGRGGRSG